MYQVYVLSKKGKPLMPTKDFGMVKRMLKNGQAKVVKRKPFTIQLLYETTSHTQPLILGVDPGRSNIGVAVVKKDTREPVFFAELETRNKDIPKLMSNRKMYRMLRRRCRRDKKKRRAKKCGTIFEWEKKVIPGTEKPITWKLIKGKLCRFSNRVRPEGWFTPTANHLLQSHKNFISLICSILPITKIKFEYNRFDIQKIKNSNIKPQEYSKGRLFGYSNAREFVLERDNHKCVLCGKNRALETHHVKEKSKGGADTVDNLVSLCARWLKNSCHEKVHTLEKWKKKLLKKFKGMNKHYQPTTLLNIIMPRLYRQLKIPKQKTFGYLTKEKKQILRLKKKHFLDAFLVALPVLHRTNLEKKKYKEIFGGVLRKVQDSLIVYHFKQFRRHNRAAVEAVRDRHYLIEKEDSNKVEIVAKNRGKRTGQTFPSLKEYGEDFDYTRPGKVCYRSGKGFKPGDVVLYEGKRKVVKGSGGRGAQTVLVEGKVKSKDCVLLLKNSGIVCL